ncbi:hypothetical protein FRACA_10145 [Frankia canadensis]|uniref:TIR domain-containing protein n=1 Tax=Frankia canadensis TaxID=1836972 RepID=A0A2I2KIA0_9ACTN|nr:hypothetical protein FRACA_10145 [Frankia canadensis]SOU52676.1 hypothetical protein FRACA_10145 [Frankia canadensis]
MLVQAWDFVAGSNWQVRMQQGVRDTQRTIAVLSGAYLNSVYGQAEWQAAHAADPQGFARKLLPVRVEDCPRPGLLGAVVSIDLFDHHDADKAGQHLLDHLSHAVTGRAKPVTPPRFPTRHLTSPAHAPTIPSAKSHPTGAPGEVHTAWDVTSHHAFTGNIDAVLVLAALPLSDGRTLLASAAANDDQVRLWDPATGQRRHALRGHEMRVHALAAPCRCQTVALR